MNRINRKTEYALMALKFLLDKKSSDLTAAKEISDSLKTPFDATARVMQIMASHGLLRSEQGANGGYALQKNWEETSLLSLTEMIEGPQSLTKCTQKLGESCDIHKTCNVISPLSFLNEKMNGFYNSITLKEILNTGSQNEREQIVEVSHV